MDGTTERQKKWIKAYWSSLIFEVDIESSPELKIDDELSINPPIKGIISKVIVVDILRFTDHDHIKFKAQEIDMENIIFHI